MVTRIGTHFPLDWPYGKDELEIFNKTHSQVDNHFPNQRNLLINTTWFGSQFDNDCWTEAMNLEGEYDNLFLLCIIDPEYLFAVLTAIVKKYGGSISLTKEELHAAQEGDLIGMYYEPKTDSIIFKEVDKTDLLQASALANNTANTYDN